MKKGANKKGFPPKYPTGENIHHVPYLGFLLPSFNYKSTVEIDRLSIKINQPLRVTVQKGLCSNLLNAFGKVITKLELQKCGLLASELFILSHSCIDNHGTNASPCHDRWLSSPPHHQEYHTTLTVTLLIPAQDYSATGAAGTSVTAHPSIKITPLTQQVLVHQKLHAGQFDQFGTPCSFEAGVPVCSTPRANQHTRNN